MTRLRRVNILAALRRFAYRQGTGCPSGSVMAGAWHHTLCEPSASLQRQMTEPLRYTDEHFKDLEPGELVTAGTTFLGCHFEDCDFSDADFTAAHLADCTFERCEMAMATVADTVLQDVTFDSTRLTGVNFTVIAQGAIGVHAKFESCDLSFCSFHAVDLTACSFSDCLFREADFRRCELAKVDFSNCDLSRCVFLQSNLIEADLRTARNYRISPFSNRIKGMKVSLPEALSLLAELDVDLQ